MRQTIVTFITKAPPIESAARERLETIFEDIRNDLQQNPYIPFALISKLHFASFVILDDNRFEPLLVFESNFDGRVVNYLKDLIETAGKGLHEIYKCCEDYEPVKFEPQSLFIYMKGKVVRPSAYHLGTVGRSVDQIRDEHDIREKIETFLDDALLQGQATDSVSALRSKIKQKFPVHSAGPGQTLTERSVIWLKLVASILVVLVLSPLLVPLALVWVIILRRKEKQDFASVHAPDANHIRALGKFEDRIVQNHLASITVVKSGFFRRWTLRTVLWIANLVVPTRNKGELSGIPSIHFAHWSLIDNGRRLLFLSNYDGSWISYLDDFIDKASFGLTAIWSNTDGFPPTRFLLLGGARNESDFKTFARNTQTQTLVWYSSYPNLTVQNIDNNSMIRQGLAASLDENAVKEWLQLF